MSPRFLWNKAYSFGPTELVVSLPIHMETTRAHLHGDVGSQGKDLSWRQTGELLEPHGAVEGWGGEEAVGRGGGEGITALR